MSKTKILFVCMTDSIHSAKYMRVFENDDRFDVRLFPVYYCKTHDMIANNKAVRVCDLNYINKIVEVLSIKHFMRLKYYRLFVDSIIPIVRKLSERGLIFNVDNFGDNLYREILKFKPDIIHSMEFQHASYLVWDVHKKMVIEGGLNFPRWIVSNWGSDIYLFRYLGKHRDKIMGILKNCDNYISECKRDIDIATELGLDEDKIMLPVIPNSGWFYNDMVDYIPNVMRKYIMIKGYQGWSGRSFNALEAIKKCFERGYGECFNGFTIVLYSCSKDVEMLAEYYSNKYGFDYKVIPSGADNSEIIKHFKMTKLYLGLGISDGISTSLLEAMGCGAFPIQSNTSCANEWIKNGSNGYIVDPYDINRIALNIETALSENMDKVCRKNIEIINERMGENKLKEIILKRYLVN